MKNFPIVGRFAVLLIPLFFFTACSKEDPNPEERDPIFKDLEKRAADTQKAAEEAHVKVKEIREKLAKSDPNSTEQRDLRRELAKTSHEALENDQWARFYKIRSRRRKVVDSLTYKAAFHAKKSWPNSREYSEYLVNRRLSETNRNWNARVPRLQDRIPSSSNKPTEKKSPQTE